MIGWVLLAFFGGTLAGVLVMALMRSNGDDLADFLEAQWLIEDALEDGPDDEWRSRALAWLEDQ